MPSFVTQKNEILTRLQENAAQLETFGVSKMGLFGSFVREQQQANSDIDLFVEFQASLKTFDNFMGLSFFLEELLGHRVEIVTPESLSPYIGPHILKEIEYVTFAA